MTGGKRVALVGDYNRDVTAHIAIPKALEIASNRTGHLVEGVWVATSDLHNKVPNILCDFDAVWCVPASPYASMDGALQAVRYARENNLPFLGTCGGYQHAVLEFARNVLGHAEADNGEVNPDAEMPLVAPLVCALVEQSGDIEFVAGSQIAKLHNATRVTEKYHCSYGIAPQYVGLFDDGALDISGFDAEGEPRAIEIKTHPYFIGTAYQPERSALTGASHPLIEAFVSATAGKLSLAAWTMKSCNVGMLRNALENSWSLESSTLWTEDNPAAGQCGVTALVVQDHLGGEILETKYGSIWHFYNRIDGKPIDFTKSQFVSPIEYAHHPSNRDEAFGDTNSEQYDYLRSAVQRNMRGERASRTKVSF